MARLTPTPTSLATDPNAIAALGGLKNYQGINQSLLNVYNPALALNDTASANRAGAQLSPTATNSAASSAITAAYNPIPSAVNDRLDGIRVAQATGNNSKSSGIATGESATNKAVWGRAFGGTADQDQRNNVSGYHANFAGFMIGGDVEATPDWRIGGVASYAHTNVDNDGNNNGSSASVNGYGLTAYAGYGNDTKPWYLNLTAGAARQHYDTSRNINFTGFSGVAKGSFNGDLYSMTAQAGYPLKVNAATFTPLAGVSYSRLNQDSYTETGGNGAALRVKDSAVNSLMSDVGMRVEQSFDNTYGTLTPWAQLSWRHEFHDNGLNTSASLAVDPSGSTAFSTKGATLVPDTARLVLGVTLVKSDHLSLLARYNLDGASGYTAQTGDVTVRWAF